MELEIIGKGATFSLDVVSKQSGDKSYYFGAGWDNPNGPVDLDIVCALAVGGKLTNNDNFIYFGNRTAPGVSLSEDNTTGDGDGDDESIVINTASLAADVDAVYIGLAAYSTTDFASAPNPHFRVCDGDNEKSEQIGDVVVGDGTPGDTVLNAFKLTRSDNGWALSNIGEFSKHGNGTGAIHGFGGIFK